MKYILVKKIVQFGSKLMWFS